ncbi:hypothetical protein B0F90DRAFT_1813400 [Multifurca ochricompacta]|uniref:Uncharacterized protein n=1 Tax=Multifurca ochricompacta TaxID=376703 RepID=A0AAD4MDI8_9AGAM|nr:hypothetical protein B0F90DRAFT_1813400 [Multifurca ochricompacta]
MPSSLISPQGIARHTSARIPHFPLDMYPRGRSRDISPVALARQASEERRCNRISIMSHYPLPTNPEKQHTLGHFYHTLPPSSSPSPSTTPFALTPPDPTPFCTQPRARIVHPNGAHAPIDPRESSFIMRAVNQQPLLYSVQSQVSSPLPSDRLVEKPDSQLVSAQRAREQARAKSCYETLARAEQVFATILERSRRERLAALLIRARQEDELKERERATREMERLEQERDRPRLSNCTTCTSTYRSNFRVLARASPSSAPPQQRQVADRFTYTFPVPSTSSFVHSAPMRQQQGSMKTRLGLVALTNPNVTNAHDVSFDDIRASMRSVLFPITHGDSVSGKTRRESELLGTLLEAVGWEEGERWQQRGRANVRASRVPEIVPGCEACASASLSLDGFSVPPFQTLPHSPGLSASTSASVASRPISWLSFGSRKSASSIHKAQITPPEEIKDFPSVPDHPSRQHSCRCTRGQCFVAVDVNDSPLGNRAEPSPAPVPSTTTTNTCRGPPQRRRRKGSLSVRTWFAIQSSVTSMLSTVTRIQHVYVTATIATLAATEYAPHEQTPSHPSKTRLKDAGRHPSGWRAKRSDVARFTSSTPYSKKSAVPYIVFDLVELEGIQRSLLPTSELLGNIPSRDPIPSHSPTSRSLTIPHTYYNADRPIFNANPLHLLSRAQINSWRFRGAPGAMPARVFCRPELFYRLETGGGTFREARGGSALKWSWRVAWDTEDNVGY